MCLFKKITFAPETEAHGVNKQNNVFPLSMQIPSGFYLQTMNSNLNLNGFFLPIAAMNVISTLPFLILAPVLDCLNTCLFNAKSSRWSPTVYISEYYFF